MYILISVSGDLRRSGCILARALTDAISRMKQPIEMMFLNADKNTIVRKLRLSGLHNPDEDQFDTEN